MEREATVSILETVQQEGNRKVKRKREYYNLDAIIAVGYRVNSYQATQFRIWATKVLKEFMIKGFALDDERLKQGKQVFGRDYFEELLERIREIRASERRFYQKIADIYGLAADYDKDAPITRDFFATVQNKLHWAIEADILAQAYLDHGIVGPGSRADALHVALATVGGADVIVSWNFKHVVNLGKIRVFNAVNLEQGYSLIEIRTPKEVLINEKRESAVNRCE